MAYGIYIDSDFHCSVGAFFNELAETYRVVKDSQMILFEWDDVEGSSHTERIESITDKLLSSKQQFLKINNTYS